MPFAKGIPCEKEKTMTIAEIKKEALRLMGVAEREIEDVPLSTLEGESAYAPYLRRMTGAINRALSDLERRLALTPVRWDAEASLWRHEGAVSRLSLSLCEGKIYEVLCVLVTGAEDATSNVPFVAVGEELSVARLAEGARATILYIPTAEHVVAGDESVTPAHVPGTLLSLIPYFIKEELYFEEEPSEALRAGATWASGVENYLATRRVGGTLNGGRVGTVYAQVAL